MFIKILQILCILALPFSLSMVECMEARKKNIFSHPAVLSCMFIDPRVKGLLTEPEKTIAMEHMFVVNHRIKTLAPSAKILG